MKDIFDPMRVVDEAISQSCNMVGGCGNFPHPKAGTLAKRAERIITIDSSHRSRLERLSWARKRWVGAGPGREVVIMKGGSGRFDEGWVAVFVEDDKGILSVRGATAEDAIEQAIALLEPSKKRK